MEDLNVDGSMIIKVS